MRFSAIVPALVILTGCVVQHGTKIDLELVKTFRPGVTTRDQVEAQLGKPTTVVVMGQRTALGWRYSRGTSFGGAEAQIVTLQFGADGVLLADAVTSQSVVR